MYKEAGSPAGSIVRKLYEAGVFDGRIHGAVFDVDGTILDSMQIWEHAGEWYLEKQGKRPEEGLSDKLFHMSLEKAAEYIKEAYGIEAPAEEIVSEVLDITTAFYHEEVQLKEGIREILEEFRRQGIPMAIATAGDKELDEAAFSRLGILDYFKKIFTCTEVGAGKTQPDIFLQAAAYMGTAPEETVVFEDVLHAAQTAKKAGFYVAGVYDGTSRKDAGEMRRVCDIYLGGDETDGRV